MTMLQTNQPTFAQIAAFYGDPLPVDTSDRPRFEAIVVAKIAALQSLLGQRHALQWDGRPAPAEVPTAILRKRVAVKPKAIGAETFWASHGHAVAACAGRYGENWRIAAPMGETVLVTLPAKLCAYKGPLGTTIRYRRDHRMPGARYWPEGRLPDGVMVVRDYPRETKDREWADNRYTSGYNPGYAEWLERWSERNGLVRHNGAFVPAGRHA